MSALEWALVLACTVSAAATAAQTVWAVRFSPQKRLREAVQSAVATAETSKLRVEQIELRVTTWKAELDGMTEQLFEALDRAEQKRARAVASEARNRTKEQKLQEASPEPVGRDQVVDHYRKQVYGGSG